ncbi:cGMP-dependent protein kinase 2 isoform X3 [Syngnathoides biaculeatus]|uniref:cGMP-dependent protein kinase 2 isoform X3 n=1 Tax=Syngnathoides biaculeatus TaxID=300417 RepID=UPI002ADE2E06|nr:cGMP-dependent protein kinase 2 isoform X3 [Syngnathoides biaculeatus]
MGNGSIKTPRPEEKTCLASNHKDPPGLQSDILRMRLEYLELELAQRDHVLEAQELHLQHLQRELDAKVSQIDKLQDAIGYNNSLGCGPPELCHRCFSVINQCPSRFHKVAVEVHQRLKAKEGVSAEPTSENFCGGLRPIHISIVKPIRKDSEIKKLMNDAITNNDFLKRLEPQHMREMVDCMYEKVYTKGQLVIQEGESGNYLYVLAAGLLEVIQSGKLLSEMHPGTAFGELAILYNCKRTATVKAVVKSHIWALDRQTFQAIMMRTAQAQHEEYFSFLRSVSLLQELPEEKLAKIVDCLEVDYFQKGEYIIREGEDGNTFFIIAKGEVIVTQSTEGFAEPQQIKTLGVGDYFGEKALISEELRSANIVCNENDTHCLVVDREPHSPLMESTEVQELRRLKERIVLLPHNQPFQQLEVVATLGVGGFGRVELVKLKDEDTTFALKCIKKKHVVDTRQQEHIYSEKSILHQTNSAFIIRLFRTFRDTKYVYMLLEVCLGGELWTVLRDMNYFDEPTARFCIGCVLEAFDYLHKMGIIYRDLKPENLLLDAKGYVKMADFGFAKKIGLGKKTWTFCGTPEYVAPEVIMNKGHDFGADCWSLGILIFELLTGNPPFGGSDPIKIYTMVLYGIEKVDFPKRIGRRPDDLIRRLCKQNPVERVGNKKNGIIDIKKHKWFQGFNWEGLRGHKLLSPLKRELNGPMDHSHFDIFPPDMEITPDESSGWDKDF